MELALVPLLEELGADVEMIDVDQNPLLEEKYGEYVPVLMHGDVELCRFVLDVSKVRDYLRFLR
jgi:thioredoxin reductase (NADPH)